MLANYNVGPMCHLAAQEGCKTASGIMHDISLRPLFRTIIGDLQNYQIF